MRIAGSLGVLVSGALLVSSCGGGSGGSGYSNAGSADSVEASPSVQGTVQTLIGGNGVPLAITFNTTDSKTATDLELTTNLATLPAGWSASLSSFSCSSVSTGNGCLLNLTFAPTTDAQGTLTLDYSYTNDAGTAETGTLMIPYRATTNDTVVATAFPAGQINAVVGGGAPVTVTFDSDDGKTASGFQLTSNLSSLPSGWSSTASGLTCSSVSTGTACQIELTYAPTSAASGSLTLNYSYTSNSGTATTGSVSIPYAATINDNAVVGISTATPITVAQSQSQSITLTFTTDDQNTATELQISSNALSSLPTGWTSPSSSLSCASFGTGTGCQLVLTYAPTSSGSGTLTLPYSYADNAGVIKTGTVIIPYATSAPVLAYVTEENAGVVVLCTIGPAGSLTGCNGTGNDFGAPMSVAFSGSYAYVSDFYQNLYSCSVAGDGTLFACGVASTTSAQAPGELTVNGSWLFYADENEFDGPGVCSIGNAGALSGCVSTGAATGTNQSTGVVFDGSTAFVGTVGDQGLPGILACSYADGILSNCADAGSGIQSSNGLTQSQGRLYISEGSALGICQVGSGGLTGCTTTYPYSPPSDWFVEYGNSLAFYGGYAYLPYSSFNFNTNEQQNGVLICSLNSDGTLSNCADSGAGFADAETITIP